MKKENLLYYIIKEALQEELLSEITRYEREKGEDIDLPAEIRKFVSKSHPTKYAFTMTTIPKVGLNPKTSYNTPAGVYAYPLNLAYFRQLLDNKLPFQSDAPYCNIMKLNLNQKWLYTSRKGQDRSTASDVQAVRDLVGPDIVTKATKLGDHFSYGTDSAIFDVTYFATKDQPKSTIAWTKLLRQLGYVGVYDPGNSVIHPSEPTQLVCLDSRAYEWVATYETKAIRKKSREKILNNTEVKPSESLSLMTQKLQTKINMINDENSFILALYDMNNVFAKSPKEGRILIDAIIDQIPKCNFRRQEVMIQRMLSPRPSDGFTLTNKQQQQVYKLLQMCITENVDNPDTEKRFFDILRNKLNSFNQKNDIPIDLLDQFTDALTQRKQTPLYSVSTTVGILMQLIKHDNLSSQSLKKITMFMKWLSSSQHLYAEPISNTLSIIAKHPNTTFDIVELLPDKIAIVSDEVSEYVITRVYDQTKKALDDIVGLSNKAPSTYKVFCDIADNKNTPSSIVNDMFQRVVVNDEQEQQIDLTLAENLFANPNIDIDLLQPFLTKIISSDASVKKDIKGSRSMVLGMLRNPKIPSSIKVKVIKSLGASATSYFSLKYKPGSLDPKALEDIVMWAANKGDDYLVSTIIVSAKDLPIKFIRRLTNHSNKTIADAARSKLRVLKRNAV